MLESISERETLALCKLDCGGFFSFKKKKAMPLRVQEIKAVALLTLLCAINDSLFLLLLLHCLTLLLTSYLAHLESIKEPKEEEKEMGERSHQR